MKTLVIALLCISSFALHAQGVTTTTYYNLRYEQVPTKPDEGYITIITFPESKKQHWADITVTTADGVILQQYSYLDILKGLRRDSLIYNRPDGTKIRRSYFDEEGKMISEYAFDSLEQMTSSYEHGVNYLYTYDSGTLETKSHITDNQLEDSIYYYYSSGKLKSVETYYTYEDMHSKISYNEIGEIIYAATWDENGNKTILVGEQNTNEEQSLKADKQVFAEKMPEFPGGVGALYAYISTNLKYPKIARDYKFQGTVYLRFEVTDNGSVSRAESLRPVFPPLDFEAIRVILNSPRWNPAVVDGKKVSVWYKLPVKFTLQD